MSVLPILDSLAHPTMTGNWGRHQGVCSFESLATALDATGYSGACAVGLAGIEGYEHEAFIDACRPHGKLVPIAGYDPATPDAHKTIERLKRIGYRGLKLHPRYSRVTMNLRSLIPIFRAAGDLDLTVFYCTYLHGPLTCYPRRDPFYDLVRLLEQAPSTRVVLVHGGDVSLMRYAELVRFNSNLLLDLSLTIMKYAGSSLDMDIRFLFSQFDRRICIGTDYPEYSHTDLRRRFEELSAGLLEDKRENIAFKNLGSFLNGST